MLGADSWAGPAPVVDPGIGLELQGFEQKVSKSFVQFFKRTPWLHSRRLTASCWEMQEEAHGARPGRERRPGCPWLAGAPALRQPLRSLFCWAPFTSSSCMSRGRTGSQEINRMHSGPKIGQPQMLSRFFPV